MRLQGALYASLKLTDFQVGNGGEFLLPVTFDVFLLIFIIEVTRGSDANAKKKEDNDKVPGEASEIKLRWHHFLPLLPQNRDLHRYMTFR